MPPDPVLPSTIGSPAYRALRAERSPNPRQPAAVAAKHRTCPTRKRRDRSSRQQAVTRPGQHRQRRPQQQKPGSLTAFPRRAQLRSEQPNPTAQLGHGVRNILRSQPNRHGTALCDVVVRVLGDQRPGAEALMAAEKAVHFGGMHPFDQMRIRCGIGRAVGDGAANSSVHSADAVDGPSRISFGTESGARRVRPGDPRPQRRTELPTHQPDHRLGPTAHRTVLRAVGRPGFRRAMSMLRTVANPPQIA